MRQTLFEMTIGGRQVSVASYTFFLVAAATALAAVTVPLASHRGVPARRAAVVVAVGLVALAVGARLMHRLTCPHLYVEDPGLLLSFRRAGFSFSGGLLLAVPAVALACRALGVRAWRFADSSAPALGMAAALVRVGCFLNGCCYGKPTTLPWGVSYPLGSSAHTDQLLDGSIGLFDSPLPVHPTQFYEAAAALACAGIAHIVLRKRVADGAAFLAFMLGFTAFRLGNFYLLETQPRLAAPHWFYPALYTITIAAILILLRSRLRKLPSSSPTP